MLKKDLPIGLIVYEGPSELDGKPIIVVVTNFKKTANKKIGEMLQTWIIRSDIHPHDAITTHEDYSICGDCKHRKKHSCYVNVSHGPTSVYNAYRRKSYKKYNKKYLSMLKDRFIRFGSYGDPAAVPMYIWDKLSKITKGYTGYTHQWLTCDPQLKYFCMASVDDEEEREIALSMGWRTYRVRSYETDPIDDNEFVCPASKEGGELLSCDRCRACNGVSNRKNPVIVVHGWKHKKRYFREWVKQLQR